MQVRVVPGVVQPNQQSHAWVSPSQKKQLIKQLTSETNSRRPFVLLLLTAASQQDDSLVPVSLVLQLRTRPGIGSGTVLISDGCLSAAGLSGTLSREWLHHLLAPAAQPAAPDSVALTGVSAEIHVLNSQTTHTQHEASSMALPVPLLLAAPAPPGTPAPVAPAPATHATLHQLPSAPGGGSAAPPADQVTQALAAFFSKPQMLLTGQLLSLPLPHAAAPPPTHPWGHDEDALLLPPPGFLVDEVAVPSIRLRVGALHCAAGLDVHAWVGGPRAQPVRAAATEPIDDAVQVAAALVGASFTELSLSQASAPPPAARHTHAPCVVAPQTPAPVPRAALHTCTPGALDDLTARLSRQRSSAVWAPHGGGKGVLVAAAAAAAALPLAEVHAADVLRQAQGGTRSARGVIARVAEALAALEAAALKRMGPCVLHLRCAHLFLLAAAAENSTLTQRLGQGELLTQPSATQEAPEDAATLTGAGATVVRRWLAQAAAGAFASLRQHGAATPQGSDAAGSAAAAHQESDWAYFSREDVAAAAPQETATTAGGGALPAAVQATNAAPEAMATWVLSAAHPAVFEHLPHALRPVICLHSGDTAATPAAGLRRVLGAWQRRFAGGDGGTAQLSSTDERKLCALTPAQLDDCCLTAWHAVAASAPESPADAQPAAWRQCLLQRAAELTPLPQALQHNAIDESEHSHFAMLPGWRAAAPGILGDNAAAVQRTSWADVGGADDAKAELHRLVTLPLATAQRNAARGDAPRSLLRMSGILLFGPPGTGKTLLAKAVAHECGVAFHSVKGPELLDKYIGESEGNVRRLFEGARASAPCVVFFDELDALAPARGSGADSGGVSDRVVSALLAEMDACTKHPQPVFVLGATNRPDLLDSALLRPGRFDRRVYVGPLATAAAQTEVLHAQLAHMQVQADVTAEAVQRMLPAVCTGADIRGLLSRASTAALRRCAARLEQALQEQHSDASAGQPSNEHAWAFAASLPAEKTAPLATLEDFRAAAGALECSVSHADLARYEALRDSLASGTTTQGNPAASS